MKKYYNQTNNNSDLSVHLGILQLHTYTQLIKETMHPNGTPRLRKYLILKITAKKISKILFYS